MQTSLATAMLNAPILPMKPMATRTPARVSGPLQGLLWGLTAVMIWGVYLALARLGVNTGIAPVDLAFIRYSTAGLIMLPWLLRHEPRQMAGVGWPRALLLCLLAGPLFILIGASGFLFAPLAHGAVVQPAALTLGGLLLGSLVLGDKLTTQRIAGAVLILLGLACVAGPALIGGGLGVGSSSLIGDLLFCTSGLMWAVFAVLQKRWSVPPMAAVAVVSVTALALYAPLYLAIRGADTLLALSIPQLLLQILVHGVLSGVVAVYAFGRAIQLLGAARAAVFPAMVPVVAIVVGIPIAGELPLLVQIVGLVVVTLGLLVSLLRRAPPLADRATVPA